jgi:protein-tyrosine phosphatase
MAQQPLIAVRIKDGLFVGNSTAAQDDEFLFLNKVQHVVNCCSTEVSNLFAQANVQYLSFPWRDLPNTVMFDSHDKNVDQIFQFIEKGLKDGECVLVHSLLGNSRCCAVVAAYLMVKYGWTLDNTLTFMSVAHPDMQIKPYFLRQLRAFSKRQPEVDDVFHPYVDTTEFACDNEQWALRNTYLNSLTSDVLSRSEIVGVIKKFQLGPEFVPYSTTPKYVNRRRIVFIDTKQGTTVASTVTLPLHHGRSTPGPTHSVLVDTEYLPQRHSLLSSVNIDPKGRQTFRLLTAAPQQAQPPPEPQPAPQLHLSYEDANGVYPPRVDYASPYDLRGSGVVNPNVARTQVRPSSAPVSMAPRTANTVHSPFILKASAGARKGSPMPDSRRQQQQVTRDSASIPTTVTNSFVPPSTILSQQQRVPPRASSPITIRNSTPQPQAREPRESTFTTTATPAPITSYGSSDALLPKRTYTSIHSVANPQVRAASPTQRKTTPLQPGGYPQHMDPQMTLGMGLRNLFPDRDHLQGSIVPAPRTSTPTGPTPTSHRVVNGGIRNSTPTGQQQFQQYTTYGTSTAMSGGPRAARPTMTSLKKNVRNT